MGGFSTDVTSFRNIAALQYEVRDAAAEAVRAVPEPSTLAFPLGAALLLTRPRSR